MSDLAGGGVGGPGGLIDPARGLAVTDQEKLSGAAAQTTTLSQGTT